MKIIIIKGWDKIHFTKAFLLEFQLVVMGANTTILLFMETIVAKDIVGKNVDVDPTFLMLKIVENCIHPKTSPPSISVGPLEQYISYMHKLGRKNPKPNMEMHIYCWHYCNCSFCCYY